MQFSQVLFSVFNDARCVSGRPALSLFLLKEYSIPVVTYFFQAKTVTECRIVIAAAPVQNGVFM